MSEAEFFDLFRASLSYYIRDLMRHVRKRIKNEKIPADEKRPQWITQEYFDGMQATWFEAGGKWELMAGKNKANKTTPRALTLCTRQGSRPTYMINEDLVSNY